jgi:invasion protein IalB
MLDYQEVTDPFYFRGPEAAFLSGQLPLDNALRITSAQNVLSIFSNGYLPPHFTERRYPELLQNSQSFNNWQAYLHEDLCGIRTRSIPSSSNLLQFVPELHLIHFRENGGAMLNWYLPFPPIFALEQGASVSVDGRQVAVEIGEISIAPVQLENGTSTSLTRAMRNGMQMSVLGINRLNNQPVTIEFSLSGFTRSFYQMMSDCDVPNLEAWIR